MKRRGEHPHYHYKNSCRAERGRSSVRRRRKQVWSQIRLERDFVDKSNAETQDASGPREGIQDAAQVIRVQVRAGSSRM